MSAAIQASLEISLCIGQRVRHHDFHGKRVTGVVRGLSVDSEDVLHADIALDEAIVIPPISDEDRELRIWRQHVPAHELAPFDEREELIGEMAGALRQFLAAEILLPQLSGDAAVTMMEAVSAARRVLAKAVGGEVQRG